MLMMINNRKTSRATPPPTDIPIIASVLSTGSGVADGIEVTLEDDAILVVMDTVLLTVLVAESA